MKKSFLFFLAVSSAALVPTAYAEGPVESLEHKIEELSKGSESLEAQLESTETRAESIAHQVAAVEEKLKKYKEMSARKLAWVGWVDRAARAGMGLLLGVLLLFILKMLLGRFEKLITQRDAVRESDSILRMRTLSRLFYWLGTVSITGWMLYHVLDAVGVNVAPLLAGVGIAGLAFGFGGQYLIRDIINGIFILLEGQYHVNDVVKIGDLAGLVENITLRVTVLRDAEGRAIYIPNGEIKSVINMSKEWSRAVLNIGVAYKENVDRVMEVIKEAGRELRKDPQFSRLILEELQMLGVDDFGDSQVTLRCFFKTVPSKQWDVAREFRRRLKNRFDELGIEIPFPHRTLYWGPGQSPVK